MLREGADPLTRDELARYCRGRLAHYKMPRYVDIVDDFPMTVTGKVRKVEMRERRGEAAGDGVLRRVRREGAWSPEGPGARGTEACLRAARGEGLFR